MRPRRLWPWSFFSCYHKRGKEKRLMYIEKYGRISTVKIPFPSIKMMGTAPPRPPTRSPRYQHRRQTRRIAGWRASGRCRACVGRMRSFRAWRGWAPALRRQPTIGPNHITGTTDGRGGARELRPDGVEGFRRGGGAADDATTAADRLAIGGMVLPQKKSSTKWPLLLHF